MISRRFFLSGIVTTAAVASASQYIPAIAAEPQPYATVYGVGWDLEIIEHVIYEPMSVAQFGGTPAIDKFREVTAFVHAFPVEPMPEVWRRPDGSRIGRWTDTFGIPIETISTHEYGEHAVAQRTKQIAHWQKEVVKEDGFTRIMGHKEMEDWRKSLRPDLEFRGQEWTEIQAKAQKENEVYWGEDNV